MGAQEDIFEQFFKKLEKDEEFPDSVLKQLRKLWENGEIASQEKIHEAIKRGCGDASKD